MFLLAHFLERERTEFEGGTTNDFVGEYVGASFAENKINYTLAWNRGDLTVSYLGEFLFTRQWYENPDDPSDYRQKIDSQLYHDLVASYAFPETRTRIAAGITNFTDEEPPYIDLGFNASTDPSTYRLFGRSYYVRIAQAF